MNNNNPIKARLYIGGLKSLFVDIVSTLEEIENTGSMPADMLQTFEDVKNAIDMTIKQLKRTSTSIKCCDHAPEVKEEKDCESCDQPVNECECDSLEQEEEEEVLTKSKPKPIKKVLSKNKK